MLRRYLIACKGSLHYLPFLFGVSWAVAR